MICPRCHRQYEPPTSHCQYDGATLVDLAQRVDLIRSRESKLTGAIFGGRYQVRGLVGRGGMARVYLAEDLETKSPVAVKVLDPAFARDAIVRERFLREAKAAALIAHPNVVETRDYGQLDRSAPYLVMEFLFGESLGDALRRAGPLGLDIGLPVLQQVAMALEAAHAASVLHRDVKPDNIFLVGEPGEPYAVKVVDFGLAKLREASLTAAGTVVGTVEYMAPEQCVADPASAQTDVYALGVVAFRILSGDLPFRSQNPNEVLAHHLLSRPPSLDAITGPRVAAIVARMLRKNPANRFDSMTEVREDIERVMGERDGALAASTPPRVPDVYEPRSPFAENVAKVLRRTLAANARSDA